MLFLNERFYVVPSNSKRGHNIVLITFWTLIVINETISILTLNKGKWVLFAPRYVCSVLVLALGLLAPGIASNHNDVNVHLKNDQTKVSPKTFNTRLNHFVKDFYQF